ncbi:MAG: HNH endonuclease [Candidatus Pacearchaeota archaeon]
MLYTYLGYNTRQLKNIYSSIKIGEMMACVLKLNSGYAPIGIYTWQEAICDWYNGKVEIIETYEDKILHAGFDRHLNTWKTVMEMPAVVRLLHFVIPKKNMRFYQPFTRRNIYVRDNGICQFCGKTLTMKTMTLDHVIPKSRGGSTSWTNIVCSCVKCNSKKGNKTPAEANLTLINKPVAPAFSDDYLSGCIKRLKTIPLIMSNEKWRSYIYWNVELENN